MKSMQGWAFDKRVSMITTDAALTIGLRKYRELFPQGTIPSHLEEAAILTHIPDREVTTLLVTFSVQGQREPFVLFKAVISCSTGEVIIDTIGDWHELENKKLDNATSL